MSRGVVAGVLLIASAFGCQDRPTATSKQETVIPPIRPAPRPVDAAGLHNVWQLTENLYSGSSPEADEGFASLRHLGIKTVITVDGAQPDVERAHRYGLRYVHLPIGYDGVPEEQAWRIARAVRDLPGPVYIHCHHGKHRGPAAAATAMVCLDATCPAEAAVEFLRQAGTDPHYIGLYAAPGRVRRPSGEELDRLPSEFPETIEAAALAQMMVRLDERWDRIKEVRGAGWTVPPHHPDLDPPHEALQLVEQYREASRLPEARGKTTDELRLWLAESEKDAMGLEALLRVGKEKGGVDTTAAEAVFKRLATRCAQCHSKYRDVPQDR